jgi:hypothetical protein
MALEESEEPKHVNGRSRQQMLHSGLIGAAIACTAQAGGADSLGDGALFRTDAENSSSISTKRRKEPIMTLISKMNRLKPAHHSFE